MRLLEGFDRLRLSSSRLVACGGFGLVLPEPAQLLHQPVNRERGGSLGKATSIRLSGMRKGLTIW